MRKEQLTTAEILKFVRHDYLNELQLILMHIDLGNTLDAKQTVLNATEKIKQSSMLGRLGLPVIENWITTFEWVYNAFQTSLNCEIKAGAREADEEKVVAYLDQIFMDVSGKLDPVTEYSVHIDVRAADSEWAIHIAIRGEMTPLPQLPEEAEGFLVEEKVSPHLWAFTIRGR